jgi:hypothetical protein
MSPTLERILHDAQMLTAQEREQLLRELEAARPRSALFLASMHSSLRPVKSSVPGRRMRSS